MKIEQFSDTQNPDAACIGQAVIDEQPQTLGEDMMLIVLIALAPVVNRFGIGAVTRALKIFCCSSARLLEEQNASPEPLAAMLLAVEGFEAIEELLEPFRVAFLSAEVEA